MTTIAAILCYPLANSVVRIAYRRHLCYNHPSRPLDHLEVCQSGVLRLCTVDAQVFPYFSEN